VTIGGVIDRLLADGGGSDADALARLTRVPGVVWVALFWLVTVTVTVACALGGAWLMLRGLASA